MLSVVLTLFKIIGITVLVIFGIVILLLVLVAFVPVRYKGEGQYQNAQDYCIQGRATWLLHAVAARAEYRFGQPVHIYLKILGIRIYDSQKSPKEKKRNKKYKKTKNKSENVGEIQAASIEDFSETDEIEKDRETDFENDIQEQQQDFAVLETESDACKKETIFQKMKNIIRKFIDFLKNITFTFRKICDTIDEIKSNIKYYLQLLQLDSTKQAFTACKAQIILIIKKMVPQKYRVCLHLGFEDPAVLGEILAIWGMFYPIHNGNIEIQPEFGQAVLEGDFYFKGKIRVYVFIHAACILLFDKNIKRFLKQLRRKE